MTLLSNTRLYAATAVITLLMASGCSSLPEQQDELPLLPPPTLAKPLPPVPQPDRSQIPEYQQRKTQPALGAAQGEFEPATPAPEAIDGDCKAVAGSSFSECPMN